jgi:NAD(P)-dependent dehydrogenase (short-subunit alcohol dehydrogenase family)
MLSSSLGAGSIGQAIARQVSAGKQVLLADLRPENADTAAKVRSNAGMASVAQLRNAYAARGSHRVQYTEGIDRTISVSYLFCRCSRQRQPLELPCLIRTSGS